MKTSLIVILPLIFVQVAPAIELPGSSALSDLILDVFDTNADGTLDAGEWQTGVAEGFSMIDLDFDDKITADELAQLESPIGAKTGEFAAKLVTPLITQIVLSFDSNEDGSVDSTEYSEKTDTLWKKADTDNNAEISESELRGMPQALLTR